MGVVGVWGWVIVGGCSGGSFGMPGLFLWFGLGGLGCNV